MLEQNGERRLPCERRYPGEHFIGDDREAVNIAAMIRRFSKRLLRSHVLRRSGDEARLSHARTGFEHVREAEVADAHSVRSVEQHVAWLDVAMHDTVGVRVIERAR